MTIHIIFDVMLVVLFLAAYIYNEKTGAIAEFEHKLWNHFCGSVNSMIRKYERRQNHG